MRTIITGAITGAALTLILGCGITTWQWWAVMALCLLNRFDAWKLSSEKREGETA